MTIVDLTGKPENREYPHGIEAVEEALGRHNGNNKT